MNYIMFLPKQVCFDSDVHQGLCTLITTKIYFLNLWVRRQTGENVDSLDSFQLEIFTAFRRNIVEV